MGIGVGTTFQVALLINEQTCVELEYFTLNDVKENEIKHIKNKILNTNKEGNN